MGKKLKEREKHFPKASKCRSLDSKRAGDRPIKLILNLPKSIKTKNSLITNKITSHNFSAQIISKNCVFQSATEIQASMT